MYVTDFLLIFVSVLKTTAIKPFRNELHDVRGYKFASSKSGVDICKEH